MKHRTYKFKVTVPERGPSISSMFFGGFVDMLRYDGARVVEYSGSTITLRTENPPTEARWRSFGIVLTDQSVESGR